MKRYLKYISNRYAICSALLVLHISITVDTNIFQLFKVRSEIADTRQKNSEMKAEIEAVSTATEELTTSLTAREKYARENYYMKKDNEDIFVFIEE